MREGRVAEMVRLAGFQCQGPLLPMNVLGTSLTTLTYVGVRSTATMVSPGSAVPAQTAFRPSSGPIGRRHPPRHAARK